MLQWRSMKPGPCFINHQPNNLDKSTEVHMMNNDKNINKIKIFIFNPWNIKPPFWETLLPIAYIAS